MRAVYLEEHGILSAVKRGAITVDMTTTEPSLSRQIYDAARAKGVSAIDAPVSGGDLGARNATLSIMVGGDKDAVEKVMPLFQAMGKNIVHQGGPGNGQHTKMCNQIVLAGTIIGVCESLLYGFKAGLDLDTMLSSITKGAAQCWILDNLAPKMVQRNFDPGSSWSTSKRIWASRSTNASAWAWRCPGSGWCGSSTSRSNHRATAARAITRCCSSSNSSPPSSVAQRQRNTVF